MKTGKTLVELATEIQRQAESKRDYIAPTNLLQMTDEAKLEMSVSEQPITLDITPHTHNQIGQRLGIPTPYYKRMLSDSPSLLSQNVNHWFANQSERRMVRTLDGKARAFLSDRYRVVDPTRNPRNHFASNRRNGRRDEYRFDRSNRS